MSLQEYLRRLQQWRDKYEKSLDSRPRTQSLDLLSHFLTDFQWNKFDEIEVPGQYTEVRLSATSCSRPTRIESILNFYRRRARIRISSGYTGSIPNSRTVDHTDIVGVDLPFMGAIIRK